MHSEVWILCSPLYEIAQNEEFGTAVHIHKRHASIYITQKKAKNYTFKKEKMHFLYNGMINSIIKMHLFRH